MTSVTKSMTSTPILLCAATRWEARPLMRRWGLKPSSMDSFEGFAGKTPVVLLKTGIGGESAARALAGRSDMDKVRCVVSTGFAGALQPGMASGDLAADLHGLDLELVEAAREIAAAQDALIHFGRIAHSDKVLSKPAEKAALGTAARASAVDMESAALRNWCAARNIPFLAVRVVLDGLNDRLPSKVPEGENLAALARYALENFGELPAMISTGLKQKKGMRALSAFLEKFLEKL